MQLAHENTRHRPAAGDMSVHICQTNSGSVTISSKLPIRSCFSSPEARAASPRRARKVHISETSAVPGRALDGDATSSRSSSSAPRADARQTSRPARSAQRTAPGSARCGAGGSPRSRCSRSPSTGHRDGEDVVPPRHPRRKHQVLASLEDLAQLKIKRVRRRTRKEDYGNLDHRLKELGSIIPQEGCGTWPHWS